MGKLQGVNRESRQLVRWKDRVKEYRNERAVIGGVELKRDRFVLSP